MHSEQVRMSPETHDRIAELAVLWSNLSASGEPLTPSAVVQVCVERIYRQSVADLADRRERERAAAQR